MVMDQIDDLKRQYTDKYVLVDGERPGGCGGLARSAAGAARRPAS